MAVSSPFRIDKCEISHSGSASVSTLIVTPVGAGTQRVFVNNVPVELAILAYTANILTTPDRGPAISIFAALGAPDGNGDFPTAQFQAMAAK